MSKFHSLSIAKVERETRDAVAITFAVPAAVAPEFRFDPGQHLTLRAKVEGRDLRRSYSICSAVQDGSLRIAIKRNPGGLFSIWANEALKAGDTLDVMPPLGHFGLALDANSRRHYVGFAAGSGITPLLSIVKTTLAVEPESEFTLFYGNRASGTVMFREELAAIKDQYLTRFNLVHVLSREAQDIELLHGRIDRARAQALLAHWVDLAAVDAVFVCGPEGMMESVVDALAGLGYPAAKVRIERFATSIPKHEHKPGPAARAGACRVRGDRDPRRRETHVRRRKGEGEHSRRRPAQRNRASLFVQGGRLLDVPREARRGRGRHGRQLRARGLRARARLRAHLPELSGDRQGDRATTTTRAEPPC